MDRQEVAWCGGRLGHRHGRSRPGQALDACTRRDNDSGHGHYGGVACKGKSVDAKVPSVVLGEEKKKGLLLPECSVVL